MRPRLSTWLRLQAICATLVGGIFLLLAAGCLAGMAWATVSTLANDATRATFSFAWWLFALVFAIMFSAAATPALTARRRLLKRAAALAGRQEALRESRIATNPGSAPHQLALDLRTSWLDRRAPAYFLAAYPLLFVATTAMLFYLISEDSQQDMWLRIVVVSLWFPVLFFGPAWRWHKIFAVARDLSADDVGIQWMTLLGSRRSLSWDEIRLLEVGYARRQSSGKRLLFRLYGTRMQLCWRDTLGSGNSADRTQPLLDLIAARCGLVPRTLDAELAPYRRPNSPPFRWSLLSDADPSTASESVSAPSRFAPGTYALVWRPRSTSGRIVSVVIGTLLTCGALASLDLTLAAFGVAPFSGIALGPEWLHQTAICGFLTFGFFGPLAIVTGLRDEHPTVLTADEAGLPRRSSVGLVHTAHLPWSDVLDVTAIRLDARRTIYGVVDRSGRYAILLPYNPRLWHGPLPEELGVQITSEQMARLAAERSAAAHQTTD